MANRDSVLIAACKLLIVVASLAVEHGLQDGLGVLDSCGSYGLARKLDIVFQERGSGQNALGTYRWTSSVCGTWKACSI